VDVPGIPTMKKACFLRVLILSLMVYACTEKPEELNLDPETETLVEILKAEMHPLQIKTCNCI
jgi:hypothetical protein